MIDSKIIGSNIDDSKIDVSKIDWDVTGVPFILNPKPPPGYTENE
jgi:hypothetical protein